MKGRIVQKIFPSALSELLLIHTVIFCKTHSLKLWRTDFFFYVSILLARFCFRSIKISFNSLIFRILKLWAFVAKEGLVIRVQSFSSETNQKEY